MNNIVSTNNLNKKYAKKHAIVNMDLNIEKGKVTAILGPNGSGKTTLIKMLVGLLKPTSGDILIDNSKIGVYSKMITSYMPDTNILYEWMTIDDAIQLYKDFYIDFNDEKMDELLTFMKLERSLKTTELSKGMLEKLHLSLTLARDAELYILDEPIGGVDPVARDEILEAIINNYQNNATMIITTHMVRDMESLFDNVIFIDEGSIVLEGSAENLRADRKMSIDSLYKEIYG